MRRYSAHKSFERQFKKLPASIRAKFIERVELFVVDSRQLLLNDHALTGEWAGYRSINIAGDYRAVYRETRAGIVEFVAIGTHHELYGA